MIDHYVARTSVEAQQSEQDADPDARFDLWEAVDDPEGGDRGARGILRRAGRGKKMLNPKWLLGVPKLAVDVGLSPRHPCAGVQQRAAGR